MLPATGGPPGVPDPRPDDPREEAPPVNVDYKWLVIGVVVGAVVVPRVRAMITK